MRVAYLIDSLAPGGAEYSLLALAPELLARGVDLEVAYLGGDATVAAPLRAVGVDVERLGDGRGGRTRNVARVLRWLRARRPDLLHTTLFEADQAGRLAAGFARIPVVSSLVNIAYGPDQLTDPALRPWKLRAARELDSLTARRAVAFHAITGVVADTMADRLRIRRDRIHVIPRGRSEGALGLRTPERAAATRRRLHVAPNAPLVLAAARHEHQKSLDVLVRAVPEIVRAVPAVCVIIAGRRGNQSAELERLADEQAAAGAVRFLGVRDDVPDLLAAADVFVMPSRWEGFGSVLIEAMALEAPIVASDVPAIRDVLGADGATLVPVDAPGPLALAVVDVLRDPSRARQGSRALRRRFVERYEIGPIADATVAFYRDAVGR